MNSANMGYVQDSGFFAQSQPMPGDQGNENRAEVEYQQPLFTRITLAQVGGILEQLSECQEIALDNHLQAGVVDRCIEFFEGFTQGGELQAVGSDNGLELLTMEATAQDSLDSDQQIEEQERRRDDQDEAGHDHCFPQSSCQFCQEYGNTRNYFAPAQCTCTPWLRGQLKGSGHNGH